jgi:hypothetical protein
MSAERSNEERLARAAGALLWLAFSYIPSLGARYPAGTDSFLRFFIFVLFVPRSLLGLVSEYALFMKNIAGSNNPSGFALTLGL